MKQTLFFSLGFLLVLSCTSTKKEEDATQSWKEFEVFQELIQKPFQHLKDPSAMDSTTLKVTVENIKSIAEAAEKLAGSPLPDKMNNEDIKTKLQRIKNESKTLNEDIAGGTEDDVIGTQIYSIRSTFIDIKTAWEKKD